MPASCSKGSIRHVSQSRIAAGFATKRLFDIVCSSIGLLIFALPILVLYLLVRMKLGKPAFFRQIRPGLHGKPFSLLKFRTMTDSKDKTGSLLSDEHRLTRFGRLLRSTSLDELPGLWNVLKGDMSLVGPRPLLNEYLDLYTLEQSRRHEVRPGLTGWAQVNGRNGLSWDDKFALDVWYVDNRSMLQDLKIIALTITKVIRREGISQEGSATMEKFRG